MAIVCSACLNEKFTGGEALAKEVGWLDSELGWVCWKCRSELGDFGSDTATSDDDESEEGLVVGILSRSSTHDK